MVNTAEPAQVLLLIEGAIADPFRVVLPLTHTAGASDATTQPNAPSLTFDWLGPLTFDYGGTPYDLTIGARVGLSLDQAGGGLWSDVWDPLWSDPLPAGVTPIPTIPRFTGRITDLDADADAVSMLTKVTCIGVTGEAATFPVGAKDLPQQSEAARVDALAAQTPYKLTNEGTSTLLTARVGDRAGFVDLLQQTAEGTGSRLVEDGDGTLHYIGLPTRAAALEAVTLTEQQILAPASWAQHEAALVNDVTVFYGPELVAPATVRPSVTLADAISQAAYGKHHADIESQMTNEDDAWTLASIVLAHWGEAFWDAPQIAVRADVIDAATWKALMQAKLGQALIAHGVTGSPSLPAGVGKWLIEGWVQTWDRDELGGLTDEISLAVSEYERWVADGKQDSTTTAVAAPTTAPYLTPITVTATVRSQGALVTAGTVEVWNGTTLLGSGELGVTGTATISVKPKVGTQHLTVHFAGTAILRPSDGSVTVTITPVTTTAVAFTLSPSTVKAGDDVAFTATVTPIGVTGVIRWQYQRDGSAWTDWTGHDSIVSATTGKATSSWGPTDGSGDSYVWRASYIPTAGAAFSPATSPTRTVTVLHKTTQTRTYNATGSATYQGDGDKRSDTDDLYQGYYSGTNGNQRSIATFASMAADWADATITKVEVELTTPHWNSAAGGTAVIGSYTGGGLPSSWPSSGVNVDRTRVAMDRGQTKWVNITSWAKGFATGALRSIVLGPGPSTSSEFYGYAYGEPSGARPQIRITGEVWS